MGVICPENGGSSRCQNFRIEPFNASTAVRISSSPRASKVSSTIRILRMSQSAAVLASKSGRGRGTAATVASKPPPTVRSADAKPRFPSVPLRDARSSAGSASRKGNQPPPLPHPLNQGCRSAATGLRLAVMRVYSCLFSDLAVAQPSFTTWRALPRASDPVGTRSVITLPAAM